MFTSKDSQQQALIYTVHSTPVPSVSILFLRRSKPLPTSESFMLFHRLACLSRPSPSGAPCSQVSLPTFLFKLSILTPFPIQKKSLPLYNLSSSPLIFFFLFFLERAILCNHIMSLLVIYVTL